MSHSKTHGDYWGMIGQRDVYLWGAGQQGRGMCRLMERRSLEPKGFIDASGALQGGSVFGYPVHSPLEILARRDGNGSRPFIIVTPFFHQEAIMEQCRQHGFEPGRDCVSYKEIEPYNYSVDISGVCNLKCISCPRGSHRDQHPPAGFMSSEVFGQVLDKVQREDPLVGSLQLYQWGEPLLNPELPDILRIANAKGIPCAVSSNLNSNRNLRSVIEAGPAWFRVSLSGVGERYEKTHTGGRWDLVLANLEALAQHRDRLNPDMKTEIFYHLYRDNQGEQLDLVAERCDRLGFEFHPVWAYLISLDDVLCYLEGGSLSREAEEAAGLLALSLEEGMALARGQGRADCLVDRCININWDLTVSQCMMFFYRRDNVAKDNFLNYSLEEIVRARRKSDLCRRCRAQSLHRYCHVYNTLDTHSTEGGKC
jgi:MoaA/NifB/PqqE/SkfB family radical SAM enzyme